jgi:membrane associated rhomboid family serine protease
MLDDRPYMRQPTRQFYWSATMALLVANVVAFFLQYLIRTSNPVLYNYLPLSLDGLRHGCVWQLVTFQFMHGGILHLVFNCWALYFFGREVESALGQRNFLILYFASGIVGGLCQMAGALAWPYHFGEEVVGASAGVFGLVAAFAVLYPDRPLMMLLFFVIPVNMRAKFLLWFSAAFALVGIVLPVATAEQVPGLGGIAHAAHLGGMLMGVFYIRQIIHWNWQWPRFGPATRPAGLPRPLVKVHSQKAAWKPSEPPAELTPEEFVSKEVDPILDKISAHGIQSLTERERRILEAARKRMAKR